MQTNGENNADLVIQQLRQLQQMVFSFDVTDKDIFNRITSIISTAELASQEIRTNYEEVSKSLTDLMNGKRRPKNENG